MISPLFLLIAFAAGLLTVLAPCILPLLPVIIGGSVSGGANARRAFTIVSALGFSVVLFTLILKASTAFIAVPPMFWQFLSGGLLIAFGLVTAFPSLWESVGITALMNLKGNRLMAKGEKQSGFWGDVLVGIALGPVFSSCSPTYFIVLATILPAHPLEGFLYLVTYAVGLSLALFAVAFIGQTLVDRLGIASDPRGWFKRSIGILFILVGLAVTFGLDKILAASLPSGAYGIASVEQRLLQFTKGSPADTTVPEMMALSSTSPDIGNTPSVNRPAPATKTLRFQKAHELVTPDGYLNTGGAPLSLGQLKGKKVVLIDFWTYSCINCQRTIPYVNAWYDKYKSQGLEIIGVHTPEFAFEHVEANVADALKRFNITHPVVLDNQYQTWNAFGNQFWPHMYLIDIDGYIVYDHIGEGNYRETEKAIQDALQERADALGTQTTVPTSIVTPTAETASAGVSPETYFGASRNNYLGNGKKSFPGIQTITLPSSFSLNTLYLGGTWDFGLEKATADANADVVYTYNAKEVYLVAGSDTPADIEVYQDGVLVSGARGADVNASGIATIGSNRLYKVIKNTSAGKHTLRLHTKQKGIQFFTFTFG
jgi:cytochrome c biogenesis protein CcdA/thiol-disulfide isomerase/thioredoxin